MEGKPILLLTATVNVPEGLINTHLVDVDLRIKQYKYALDGWKSVADKFTIVMIENSDTLIDHESIRSGLIKYVNFVSNQDYVQLGKGKGELEIIRHLYEHIEIDQDQVIVKATGRQYVENISKLFELYSNKPSYVMCNFVKSFSRTESKLVIATSNFYLKYLLKLEHLIDESKGVCFEDVLRDAVLDAMRDGRSFSLFPRYPRLHSLQVQGDSDRESKISQIKNMIKARVKYRLLMERKAI